MPLPALTESSLLRYFAFAGLYFAQGLPEGLLTFAVPPWLAQQGASEAEIGGFLGVVLLPWSLKLLNGPIMDRFSFLAMGRRRPWVLGAQLGLVVSFALVALIPDPSSHLVRLTAAGFLVNFFSAFQDVAVDGMAIDILPVEQQARANGLMWGGKILGISAAAAGGGWLLSTYGMSHAVLGLALLVAAIMLIPLLLRERPGERILPWSAGRASEIALQLQLRDWRSIGRSLFRAFLLPMSLVMAAAFFLFCFGHGIILAAVPVLTVRVLGWADTEYPQIVAMAGLVSGVFGMALGGILIDFVGRIRMVTLTLALMICLGVSMASLTSLWTERAVVVSFAMVYYLLFVLTDITLFSVAMQLCWKRVAATQFALYMAIGNLGTAAGGACLGPLRSVFDYSQLFLVAAGFATVALVLLRFLDLDAHRARAELLDAEGSQ